MKSENEIKTTFSGNIVELYNTGDKLSAKVLLEPGYLKVSGDELKDTHLGDQVDVTCEFRIVKIKPHFGAITEEY